MDVPSPPRGVCQGECRDNAPREACSLGLDALDIPLELVHNVTIATTGKKHPSKASRLARQLVVVHSLLKTPSPPRG
eukprot:2248743-Amphidinium_carterae.1